MRGLYVFTHDLRLHDNRLLQQLIADVDELICLYILDSRYLQRTRFQTHGLGVWRQRFLWQTLQDLSRRLETLGQRLLIQVGDSRQLVPQWVKRYSIDQVAMTFHPGVYEQQLRDHLLEWGLPLLTSSHSEQFTLLSEGQLPFDVDDFSMTFTKFRKQIEPVIAEWGINRLQTVIEKLPSFPIIAEHETSQPLPFDSEKLLGLSSDFVGGETRGLQQLDYFCQPGRLDTYKQTRNGLDGWAFSSKLSPWLANGSLSVRQAWHQVSDFEKRYQENESTYWLKFELLWREYFQWLLLSHGERYFRFSGLTGKRPLTTFYAEHYKAWIEGNTGYPGVDAAMRQLKQTGWMSNRARQWVASCFVHELGLDWRFGAAWFEYQLVDFDVASNWGNWLYLAGVGTDPRGSRQFNLEKQLKEYDPEGIFVKNWL